MTTNGGAVCTATNITHAYGARPALEDVSLELLPATVVGLVGANGSGKSTLLRILAGVQRPTSGRIMQFGANIAANEAAGRGLGAAVDGMAAWPSWSVRKNLEYIAGLSGASGSDVAQIATLVGITSELGTRLKRLSLGNRQRVLLGAAILTGTRLVLLDEPMNGLDPDARQRIRDLIITLSGQGRTVLLSSHDLHDVESLCSQLLVLDEGRLAFSGPTSDFGAARRMTVLRVDTPDVDRAQVLLTGSGVRCRRDSSGAPAVHSHDAATANRILTAAGIRVIDSEERPATLEERFHGRH